MHPPLVAMVLREASALMRISRHNYIHVAIILYIYRYYTNFATTVYSSILINKFQSLRVPSRYFIVVILYYYVYVINM